MRSFATILASAAAVLLSAGTAMADGMSIKDGPAPVAEGRTCDGGPFAGFYIGAAVGYADQNTDYTSGFGDTASSDDGGFTGGIYSGYNIQCGRFVVGYESDWNFMDTNSSWVDSSTLCGIPCLTLASDIEFYGTSRLRFGLVHSGNMMFYATGGLAYARVENSIGVPSVDFRASDTDWNWGWTAGGGVEFLRHGRWGLRAEALYVDLSEDERGYFRDGCIECTGNMDYDNDFWVGRIGLTYRFGPREEAVVPMK